MTKVVKLHSQPTVKGTSWFLTNDLMVGLRLRFRSYKMGIEETYRITSIMDRNWRTRRSKQAERTDDKVRMMSPNGKVEDRAVMYLRCSVQWELLDVELKDDH
jgi:hypothetical protein